MKFLIATLLALCAACVSDGGARTDELGKAQYNVISVLSDFNAEKLKDMAFVSVSGYLSFGDDKHNLWASEEDYKYVRETMPPLSDPAWDKCVSLNNYGGFRRDLLKYDGRKVIVFGYISQHVMENDEVNLGSCNEVFISLEGIGARVMPRRQ